MTDARMPDPPAPLDYRAPADDAPAGSIRRDLAWAYAAAGAKAASWAAVSAVVYRADATAFALLALVRATVGLLNYTSLGLAPGMIRLMTESKDEGRRMKDETGSGGGSSSSFILLPSSLPSYSTGVAVALLTGVVGVALTLAYALLFDRLHRLPPGAVTPTWLVMGMGFGTVLRLTSDAPAAVLQTTGRIAADNRRLVLAEVTWAAITAAGWAAARTYAPARGHLLDVVGGGFALSGLLLLLLRLALAARLTGRVLPDWRLVTAKAVRRLLAFGSLVTVAQLADFLYAPTDYVLINRLISPAAVAAYAPAVQIDAGLLLIVSGLSAVLLPRAALAHAAGSRDVVRRYYVRGTLASAALLLAAAAAVWAASPVLLRVWLGSDVPATRALLPLVLVHTVVGGTAGVGRAVLLAMGKIRPFTASVLVAGAANVLLSYSFVRFCGWGLTGIILGTIVAVVGRCAVWTPWYVLRVLGREWAPRTATS